MSVSITSLGPTLLTEFTLEGFLVSVKPEVVIQTAQLFEGLVASFARQHLIHPFRDTVASIGDLVFAVLSHSESVHLDNLFLFGSRFNHELLNEAKVARAHLLAPCCKGKVFIIIIYNLIDVEAIFTTVFVFTHVLICLLNSYSRLVIIRYRLLQLRSIRRCYHWQSL